MARPKLPRTVRCKCNCTCFSPDRKTSGEGVVVDPDEFEAIKLYDVDNLDQIEAAKRMKISQPTFARILSSAHKKISTALINGQKINFS